MATKKVSWADADGASLTQLSFRKDWVMSGLDQHTVRIPVSYSFSDDTAETWGTTASVQGPILSA